VGNAAWKDKRVRNKGEEIILKRGELLGAYFFLAKSWNWSVGTVRWYLQDLKNNKQISQRFSKHNNQAQIILIENYDKFQIVEPLNDKPTTSEQQAAQQHYKDNNLTIKQEVKTRVRAPAREDARAHAEAQTQQDDQNGSRRKHAGIRDTSESFDAYRARMIAEGKFQP